MEDDVIKCKAIIEMLGAPKEHIEQVLKDFVEKRLKSPTANFKILAQDYAPAKEAGKLFSTFVELEIECKKVDELVEFCFDAMPSSIEIYQPKELTWAIPTINGLLNDCSARIHETDMLVKNLRSENRLLNQNSIELLRNFVRYVIKEGNNSIDKISTKLGIKEEEMKPFLDRMIEDNQLILQGDQYAIP